MKPNNASSIDHFNPSVCCAKSCGEHCNDCYGESAISWNSCLRNDGVMCDQGVGGRSQCCANAIPPNRICSRTILAPCRLGN